MNPTLHPFFVHLPIAIAILLPFFIGSAMMFYRKNQENANQIWYFTAVAMVIMAIFTIFSLMSGKPAEEILEKLINEEAIETHEDMGELFGIVTLATTGLALFLFIFKGKLRQTFMYVLFALSLVLMVMGLYTGKTGGEVGHAEGGATELHKAIEAAGGDWRKLAEEHEEHEEHEEKNEDEGY